MPHSTTWDSSHSHAVQHAPLTPSRLQLHSDGDAVHGDQHLDRLRLIFDGCEEVERLIAVGRARSDYSSAHPLLHVGSHCARRRGQEGTERCGASAWDNVQIRVQTGVRRCGLAPCQPRWASHRRWRGDPGSSVATSAPSGVLRPRRARPLPLCQWPGARIISVCLRAASGGVCIPTYLNFCCPFFAASLFFSASSLRTFSTSVDVHCPTLFAWNGTGVSLGPIRSALHACARKAEQPGR